MDSREAKRRREPGFARGGTAWGTSGPGALLALSVLLLAGGWCQGQAGEDEEARAASVRALEVYLDPYFARWPGRAFYDRLGVVAKDRIYRCREIAGVPPAGIFIEGVPDREPLLTRLRGEVLELAHAARSPAQRLAWLRIARYWQLDPGIDPQSVGPLELPPLMTWTGSVPLESLETQLALRHELGADLSDAERALVAAYLGVWRTPDGGFGYPASLDEVFAHVEKGTQIQGMPARGDRPSTLGAIASAVVCYRLAGLGVPEVEKLVERIRRLRCIGGGYRSGNPESSGRELWASYDALRALQALDRLPKKDEVLRRFIARHRHTSGGFAHTEDEPPSLEATWLAMECLGLLRCPLPPMPPGAWNADLGPKEPVGELRRFEALIEIGPDPAVSLMLAGSIGADLILLKGTHGEEPELARRARRMAEAWGLPIAVGCAREEHLRAWGVSGVGYVTHCSDLIFDPEAELGDRGRHAGFAAIDRAWQPAREAGAMIFSCSYQHRELLAPAYDRSARGEGGYDALMAGWAFAEGGDVIRANPWLGRYVGRVPLIANHDAHGDPFHWFERGLRSRCYFFARSGDLAGFRDALAHNRLVVVTASGAKYGRPPWTRRAPYREFSHWRHGGWQHGRKVTPPLAIPIDAASASELPHLEEGFGIMVRAAVDVGDDALPHEVRCEVDGDVVELQLAPPGTTGAPVLWAPLPDLKPGEHRVTVEGLPRVLRFSQPIPRREAPAPFETGPPEILDFASPAQLPFVKTVLIPGDLEGQIKLRIRRADFFVSRPAGARLDLVLDLAGGKEKALAISVNGRALSAVSLNGHPGTLLIPVPEDLLVDGIQRITIRAPQLPTWLPSYPVPDSDLVLFEIGLRPDQRPR